MASAWSQVDSAGVADALFARDRVVLLGARKTWWAVLLEGRVPLVGIGEIF